MIEINSKYQRQRYKISDYGFMLLTEAKWVMAMNAVVNVYYKSSIFIGEPENRSLYDAGQICRLRQCEIRTAHFSFLPAVPAGMFFWTEEHRLLSKSVDDTGTLRINHFQWRENNRPGPFFFDREFQFAVDFDPHRLMAIGALRGHRRGNVLFP